MLLATKAFSTEAINTASIFKSTATFDEEQVYRLELRNNSGTMLAYLDRWYAGRWSQRVNEPAALTFRYPYNESKATNFAFPNQVWLYNGAGELLEKFHIAKRTKSQDMAGLTWEIKCKSLISQLSRELITSYSTNGTPTACSTIVSNWLSNFQTHSSPILFGNMGAISPLTVNIDIDYMTIMQAIRKLHRLVGGYIEVTPGRRLNWRRWQGENKGQQIRLGKNMINMSVEEDFEPIVTRLYGLGEGETPDTRLALTSPGYIDRNTGTYGTITGVLSDTTIANSDELSDAATAELDKISQPVKTYNVGSIDLSQIQDSIDRRAEFLKLGSKIWIVNGDLGEEFQTRILSLDRDLDRPLRHSLDPGTLLPGAGSGGSAGGFALSGASMGAVFGAGDIAAQGPGALAERSVVIQVSDPDAGTSTWGANDPTRKMDAVDAIASLFEEVQRAKDGNEGFDTTFNSLMSNLTPAALQALATSLVGDSTALGTLQTAINKWVAYTP